MFCENCGNKLDDGDKFCKVCGTPVSLRDTVVPVAQVERPSGSLTNKKTIAIVALAVSIVVIAIAGVVLFESGLLGGRSESISGTIITNNNSSNSASSNDSSSRNDPSLSATQESDEVRIAVPNIEGLEEGAARDVIESIGLSVGSITDEESETIEKGLVISQSVPSGSNATTGTRIDIVVSSGTAEHEYTIIAGKYTWDQAEARCEELGGTLACITSQEEYDKVLSAAQASGYKVFWIGGRLSGNTFTWITGESMAFSAWASGEPNNDQGIETRMALFDAEGSWGWYDVPNDLGSTYPAYRMAFILER